MDKELGDLNKTLKNIQDARPFSDLTVDEVVEAQPEIDKRTEQLVSKGRWAVPGYKVHSSTCETTCRRKCANHPTGEIWRFVRSLDNIFQASLHVPSLNCITYVSVNSYGEWKCMLDLDESLYPFSNSCLPEIEEA